MTILLPKQQALAFRVVVLGLVALAVATFMPLWPSLLLAAWAAVMVRPFLAKMARVTRGRQRAAGVLVVLFVMAVFLPLVGVTLSLARGAGELTSAVMQSSGAKGAFLAIASTANEEPSSVNVLASLGSFASAQKLLALAREHGAGAAKLASGIAGAALGALLGLFVFVYAFYVFLVDGRAIYAWLEKHSPLRVGHTRRLVAAFHETGRGLFVGVGLTGLAQGIVATVSYVALGVPRALVLGLLTCIASLLPSIGTALVWVPVAIGLALAGKTGAAAIMVAVGVLVIGTVDNVMRPVFARFGNLQLSNFALLLSIFGGLAAFDSWGLVLGPLFARLAKEALMIANGDHDRDTQNEPDLRNHE